MTQVKSKQRVADQGEEVYIPTPEKEYPPIHFLALGNVDAIVDANVDATSCRIKVDATSCRVKETTRQDDVSTLTRQDDVSTTKLQDEASTTTRHDDVSTIVSPGEQDEFL
jgi:hypothetical protein